MMSSLFKLCLLDINTLYNICQELWNSWVPSNETTTNFGGEKLKPTASRESYLHRELPTFLKNSHSHTRTHIQPHSKTLRPTRKAYVHSYIILPHCLHFPILSKSKSWRWSPYKSNSFDLGEEGRPMPHMLVGPNNIMDRDSWSKG